MKAKKKNLTRITNEAIVAALKATDGKVYIAADRLQCHPETIYSRAKKVKAVHDTILHARAQLVDLAETALKQAVLKGEGWAVCFTLKCQGKDRGYVERQEITGKDGGPVRQEVNHVHAALADYDSVLRRVVYGDEEAVRRNGAQEPVHPPQTNGEAS